MTTTKTSSRQSYPVKVSSIPIPPGDTIMAAAAELLFTPQMLAEELQLSPADLGRLLCGEMPITEPLAIALETSLGPRSEIWLKLESRFRENLAQQAAATTPKRKRA